ncbi:MAG: hypothetical protein JWP44_5236 [Mucilaginibacter sp.]|jgi:hypothetical protein|nr:hypothetical protein [Mucilaginibacter sp.]
MGDQGLIRISPGVIVVAATDNTQCLLLELPRVLQRNANPKQSMITVTPDKNPGLSLR